MRTTSRPVRETRAASVCSHWVIISSVAFWVLLCSCPLWAQGVTERVSVGPGGVQGNGDSAYPAVSTDGRFVAFDSYATNIVAGDTNAASDVFLHDRLLGTTTRVSVGPAGVEGNGDSYLPVLSADGRFVAFYSEATNLVTGDTNGAGDVFVLDRTLGTTTRVSVGSGGTEGDAGSYYPALSADGRFVAFYSNATNLVTGDTNASEDVFVHDRDTNTTTRVSVDSSGVEGNGDSAYPAISADGQRVAFESAATNLVTGDTNAASDVFVRDRLTGSTTRVSVAGGGTEGNDDSFVPALSADGKIVAFSSWATNLVAGDTNGSVDVFLHVLALSSTSRVSTGPGGIQGDANSYYPALSTDGRFVAFYSYASNLVTGDTNAVADIFVHDRVTGATTRVSLGPSGAQADGHSYDAALSGDGRFVVFDSVATDLVAGDTNAALDAFVHDRAGFRAALPAGDYDGDGRADVAVYRPSTGVWYIIRSGTGVAVGIPWGYVDDVPVPGDYDGDHKTDVAVYRPSTGVWYIVRSSTGTAIGMRWGMPGDVPAPADFDGDGRCDPAVFRPSTGVWYELRSGSGAGFGVSWGVAGDVPVPADYDGDGRADPAVFRSSTGTWYELRSTTGRGYGVLWGAAGDVPLAGDYDGDGRADPTVYRPSNRTWYQLRSVTQSGFGVVWGAAADVPLVGDYDGDHKADPTVFRPSTGVWYQLRSMTGIGFGVNWGVWGDVPR